MIHLDAQTDSELPPLEKGVYRHSKKGQLYEVVGVALQTETNEPLVVYRPLYASQYKMFARPYYMFTGVVEIEGEMKPRFQKLDN